MPPVMNHSTHVCLWASTHSECTLRQGCTALYLLNVGIIGRAKTGRLCFNFVDLMNGDRDTEEQLIRLNNVCNGNEIHNKICL